MSALSLLCAWSAPSGFLFRNYFHRKFWRKIFCLLAFYPKIQRLKYTQLQFFLLFCMAVKLGLSPRERYTVLGFSRIVCWGLHMVTRGARWQGSVEYFIKTSTIICTPNYSDNQMKNNNTGGPCSTYGRRKVLTGFSWKDLEGKRPFGRPRRRWEENIKMGLQEVGWGHGLDRRGSE